MSTKHRIGSAITGRRCERGLRVPETLDGALSAAVIEEDAELTLLKETTTSSRVTEALQGCCTVAHVGLRVTLQAISDSQDRLRRRGPTEEPVHGLLEVHVGDRSEALNTLPERLLIGLGEPEVPELLDRGVRAETWDLDTEAAREFPEAAREIRATSGNLCDLAKRRGEVRSVLGCCTGTQELVPGLHVVSEKSIGSRLLCPRPTKTSDDGLVGDGFTVGAHVRGASRVRVPGARVVQARARIHHDVALVRVSSLVRVTHEKLGTRDAFLGCDALVLEGLLLLETLVRLELRQLLCAGLLGALDKVSPCPREPLVPTVPREQTAAEAEKRVRHRHSHDTVGHDLRPQTRILRRWRGTDCGRY